MTIFKTLSGCFITVTSLILFNSCKTYSVSYTSTIENEIKYYGFKEKDTILDFSVGQSSVLPLAAIVTNNLHFYLGYIPQYKLVSKQRTEHNFTRFKRELKSNNNATFAEIDQNGDSLYLHDNSVDFILCRQNLYLFNDMRKITSEFHRVLKPNGELLIIQQLSEQDELSKKDLKIIKDYPLPNEINLTSFFELNGFKFIKSEQIVLNRRMEKVTSGIQTLFHF